MTRTISRTRWQRTDTITLHHRETRLVLTENVAWGINIVAHDAELKEKNTFVCITRCTRIGFFRQNTEVWTLTAPTSCAATEQQDDLQKSSKTIRSDLLHFGSAVDNFALAAEHLRGF